MKTEDTKSSPTAAAERLTDSTKLVSLLALATGAVAMPQTSEAVIRYTDLTQNPVGVSADGYVTQYSLQDLPGAAGAQFGIGAWQRKVYTYWSVDYRFYRYATAGMLPGGTVNAAIEGDASFGAVPLEKGAAWNPAKLWTHVYVGSANSYGHYPASGYEHKYLAFVFSDTSHSGAMRYGWMEVSLGISNVSPYGGGGPSLVLYGYAYDDSGAMPAMGETAPVPEPSSVGLLALGALALGARGLRAWRRKRPATSQA